MNVQELKNLAPKECKIVDGRRENIWPLSTSQIPWIVIPRFNVDVQHFHSTSLAVASRYTLPPHDEVRKSHLCLEQPQSRDLSSQTSF